MKLMDTALLGLKEVIRLNAEPPQKEPLNVELPEADPPKLFKADKVEPLEDKLLDQVTSNTKEFAKIISKLTKVEPDCRMKPNPRETNLSRMPPCPGPLAGKRERLRPPTP